MKGDGTLVGPVPFWQVKGRRKSQPLCHLGSAPLRLLLKSWDYPNCAPKQSTHLPVASQQEPSHLPFCSSIFTWMSPFNHSPRTPIFWAEVPARGRWSTVYQVPGFLPEINSPFQRISLRHPCSSQSLSLQKSLSRSKTEVRGGLLLGHTEFPPTQPVGGRAVRNMPGRGGLLVWNLYAIWQGCLRALIREFLETPGPFCMKHEASLGSPWAQHPELSASSGWFSLR